MRLARSITHLQSVHEMDGSPFAEATMMALRLIRPDSSALPQQSPPEDGNGAGGGGQEDEEMANVDASLLQASRWNKNFSSSAI